MLIALTRAVPPSINRCELTHVGREPIDLALALTQHERYERALQSLGCTIQRVAPEPDLPDSVFVEDTAIVLDEIAVITRPGAESRRGETSAVGDALGPYRDLALIEPPGTLDGGDVLRIGSRIYVGRSRRSNDDGIRQLEHTLKPLGYTVVPVPVNGCLHLKSAITQVASGTVLFNPAWVSTTMFGDVDRIEIDPREPFAANALLVNETVLVSSAYPRTRELLERRGIPVHAIETTELAKGEGGVTCCSLIFHAG